MYDRDTDTETVLGLGADDTNIALAADGSAIAFVSSNSGLVEGDTNRQPDLFVYRPGTKTLTRVEADINSIDAGYPVGHSLSLSADGSLVAFLVPDQNGNQHAVVHDFRTGTTIRPGQR